MPRSWSALLGTFTAAPNFLGYRDLPGSRLSGAVVPGTTSAVIALDNGDLGVLDLINGDLDRRFPSSAIAAPGSSVVRVSTDGRVAAQYLDTSATAGCRNGSSAATDQSGCGEFSVFEIATGRRIAGPILPPFVAGDLAIDADGTRVAVAGGPDGDLAVYRVDDGPNSARSPASARPRVSSRAATPQPSPSARTARSMWGPRQAPYGSSIPPLCRSPGPSTARRCRHITIS